MERIQDFNGAQYPFSTESAPKKAYDAVNIEYATSSHQIDHDMFPGLIVFPQGDADIQKAVKHAKKNGYAVASMSGGHQYSGACSTNKNGIQLNLGSTYKGPQDLLLLPPLPPPDSNRPLVYVSVSHSLGEFNKFLLDNKLFVPHGQCTDVHLGGHAQTGGYGQLARSFGLFGDHIWGIRMINHEGEIQEITKKSNPELFYAILGGSPGNFGVITHYTVEVHRDVDHDWPDAGVRPRGYKGIWLYNETVVKILLNQIAVMSDDLDFPRNFDLCVSVLSSSFPMFRLVPELKDNIDEVLNRISQLLPNVDGQAKWPPSVVLYAQWVPMSPQDKPGPKVEAMFQKFQELEGHLKYWWLWSGKPVEPMSQMTGEWLFHNIREFQHPYDKRTYMTNSTTLVRDKWVDAVADRIDQVLNPFHNLALWNNCYLSIQIQCMGGKESQFWAHRDNGTAYSWRDSTVVQVMDCFHEATATGKRLAQEWQAVNDKVMVGPSSPFSKQDKRVLWASYGDWDMDKTWPFYFEDRAKYERIGRQRYLADPNGTFTPNPFNVKAVKH